MIAQGFHLGLRGGVASKGRKERRTLNSTSNAGAVAINPEKSCQNGSPKESSKTISTFEDEAKVGNSSLTQLLPQEIKTEKPKRFIAFIGKANHIVH